MKYNIDLIEKIKNEIKNENYMLNDKISILKQIYKDIKHSKSSKQNKNL